MNVAKTETTATRNRLPRGSLLSRFVILLVIFLIVPLALYTRFQAADAEKNDLLVEVIKKQGALIAAALAPSVQAQGQADILAVTRHLKELGEQAQANVKLLLKPEDDNAGGFFFVAAWPPVEASLLERERRALVDTGVLQDVKRSCAPDNRETARYTNAQGQQELIASLDAVRTKDGCWIVITSYSEGGLFDSTLARRYWSSPEVLIATGVYLLLAAVTVWLFIDVWINLKLFERSATDHMRGRGGARIFQRRNRFRELDRIASTFDNMVAALERSAETIRRSAEENAHAFKAPIAVMRQSLDPLKRTVSDLPTAQQRPVEIIDASLDKLDSLVSAARALDIATADSLESAASPVPLGPLLDGLAEEYEAPADAKRARIEVLNSKGIQALADIELLETALENVIENAISFAPVDSTVTITAGKANGRVRITVSDNGPGIPDDKLDMVFERYVSIRDRDSASERDRASHFGIGLFVVRRNVELMGGTIILRNRAEGGLDVIIDLPTPI